ncbi:MAG: hypothetical protein WD063_03150 [Pirellulales bacterium]
MGILDGTLTLCGQSAEYWQGNYENVNESHPVFRLFLQYHPGVFAAGVLLVHLVLAGLILLLPQTLALGTSITVATVSCFYASTWLREFGLGGIRYRVALFTLCGFMLAVGIRWGWQAEPAGDTPLFAGLPWPARWLAIVVLFGIFALLFFS